MTAYPFLPAWNRRSAACTNLIFAVPHAGGGAAEYRRLAPELRPDIDLQPLQLPGREGLASMPPVSDMAELVPLLGTAILATEDHPFGLFGHSLGSVVAAELASWLTSKGRPPRMLIVSGRGWRPTTAESPSWGAAPEATDDDLIERLVELGGTDRALFASSELRAMMLGVVRNDMELGRTYRPTFTVLDCPILALGGSADPEVSKDELAAWAGATTARFGMRLFAGDHFYYRGQMPLLGQAIVEFQQAELVEPADPGANDLPTRFRRILRDHLDDDEFDLTDDFYAAGGDSLIALAVVADAKKRGIEVSLRDLLTSPIVSEVPIRESVADEVDESTADEPLVSAADELLMPDGVEGMYPASVLQLGLIYMCEMAEYPSLYHDLIAFRLSQLIDRPALRQALDWLTRQHEALRTSFDFSSYSVPMALVAADGELPLRFIDVPDLLSEDTALASPSNTPSALADWRRAELGEYLEWDQAPLMRSTVLDEGEHSTVCLAVHHAVIDGWSLSRLVVDLLLAYESFLQVGVAPQLSAPSHEVQREFVRLERAQSADPAAHAFWSEQIEGTSSLLAATGNVPRATEQIMTPFDEPTSAALRAASVAAGVSLKSICLAVHWAALVRWSGREDDIMTGVVTNGRPEVVGADQVVGLFLNTVPLRVRGVPILNREALTGEGWSELARAAMNAESAISPYRRFPFAELNRIGSGAHVEVTFNFTRFRLYDELAGLSRTTVQRWWSWDEASFPLMADYMFDSPDFASAHLVCFDPVHVPPDEAARFVECTRLAVAELITNLAPPGR